METIDPSGVTSTLLRSRSAYEPPPDPHIGHDPTPATAPDPSRIIDPRPPALQAIRSFSSKRPRWSNSDCRDAGRRCSSDTGVHRLAIDAEHGVDSTEGERIRLGEPQGNVDSGAAPLTKCRRCDLGGQQRGQRITIGRYDLRQSTAERFSPTRLQFHNLATAMSSNIRA